MHSTRTVLRTPALAVGALALTLIACQPAEGGAGAAAATQAADAERTEDRQDQGLSTEKAKASYMIGMDIGRNLEPIKDDVELAVVFQAIEDVVAGRQTKLSDEQMMQIAQSFAQSQQEKQQAKAKVASEANRAEGQRFLAQNGQREGVLTTASGLQYQVLTAGAGPKPTAGSTVKVHYVGNLLDGSEFDSSIARNEPVTFNLEQVVPGWQEGLQLMPVGSKYRLWVPSDLGYGEAGTPGGPIGPNATLVFEVELLEIVD